MTKLFNLVVLAVVLGLPSLIKSSRSVYSLIIWYFISASCVENIYGLKCYSSSFTDTRFPIGDAAWETKNYLITCPSDADFCVVSLYFIKCFYLEDEMRVIAYIILEN